MKVILFLAIKDLRLLVRDKAGFFFMFLFPVIIAVFFGSLYGGIGDKPASGIPIVVIDEDNSEGSQKFIADLKESDELEVRDASREQAVEDVRHGRIAAYVVLKPGFGKAQEQIFWGDPPEVELGTDPARRAERGMLEGILMKYAANRFQDAFTDTSRMRSVVNNALDELRKATDMDPKRRDQVMSFMNELDRFMESEATTGGWATAGDEEGIRGFEPIVINNAEVSTEPRKGPKNSYSITFPQGMIWGILACTAGFAIGLVVERNRGTLARVQTAPVSRAQILAGRGLACFVTTVLLSLGLFALGAVVFNVRANSPLLLLISVVSISLCFVGIMMFLSVLGKTEAAVNGIAWPIIMVMAFTGGGAIPLFFMPEWLRTVSNFSPVKWAVLALEGAIWRDFSFFELLKPCGILLAVGLVFFLVGVRTFRWADR